MKQYACCTVLQVVGSGWIALIVAACFSFALCIQAMLLIGRFDQLPGNRQLYKFYSRDNDVLWQVGFNVDQINLDPPPSAPNDAPSSSQGDAYPKFTKQPSVLSNKLSSSRTGKEAVPEINVRQ